jgi:hypothetical protein
LGDHAKGQPCFRRARRLYELHSVVSMTLVARANRGEQRRTEANKKLALPSVIPRLAPRPRPRSRRSQALIKSGPFNQPPRPINNIPGISAHTRSRLSKDHHALVRLNHVPQFSSGLCIFCRRLSRLRPLLSAASALLVCALPDIRRCPPSRLAFLV